jgi:hypothetical protein
MKICPVVLCGRTDRQHEVNRLLLQLCEVPITYKLNVIFVFCVCVFGHVINHVNLTTEFLRHNGDPYYILLLLFVPISRTWLIIIISEENYQSV